MLNEFVEMIAAILELRESGYRYREIDQMLQLPRKSYRIMNGRKAKFAIAEEIVKTPEE